MKDARTKRAGIIPFVFNDDGAVEMYFMKPSFPHFGGDRFQIAKGKIEDGLSELETAIKEGSEELGLKQSNFCSPIHKLGTFMHGITIFFVQVKSQYDFDDPHFETGETRWMTAEQFEREGRELHRHVVDLAHQKILKIYEKEYQG